MKLRWVGPPNPGLDGEDLGHEVTAAGRDLGVVKPGEILDVPEDIAAEVVFPDTLWEPVKAAKSTTKKDGDS